MRAQQTVQRFVKGGAGGDHAFGTVLRRNAVKAEPLVAGAVIEAKGRVGRGEGGGGQQGPSAGQARPNRRRCCRRRAEKSPVFVIFASA